MEEANFVKNLKRGTGKYKGKLPLKCFNCGRIGHFSSKCPFNKHSDGEEESNNKTKEYKKMYKKPFQRNFYKKKSLFIKNNSESSDIDESDESTDIRLFMAMENKNDELIEEEEGEVDLEAELVSALSELKKVRRECKQFKREIESLDQELQKSNNLIESTEIMLVDLKLKIEEARVTEEALNSVLAEKDKENEGLKLEVVLLRKKVQENNMNHSSQVLDQIICSQRSTYDKTGIGYKSEVTNTSSSSSFEKAGTKHTNEKNIYKQKGSEKKEDNQTSTVHRKSYGRHQNRFEGYCFFCYKYGHKATFCNVFSRNISAHNSHGISRFEYERRHDKSIQNNVNNSHNRFDALKFEVECYRCNNFGHISRNCPVNFQKSVINQYTNQKTSYWKRKNDHLEIEECKIALQADHKVKWCVDSGCSKHMTGRKQIFDSLDERKEGTVTFGNDQSARIVGRGTVCLNKDIMAENVLLVENMEHNLLSVSQTCDKGNLMIFDSKQCQIRDVKTNQLVGTTTRTSNNIYILDEKDENCYLGHEDESWLWHKRLGHINFDNLIQLNKKEAIRNLPVIKNLSNSICKQCQHGKQTRVKFKTKEYSTTKPLEIIHADVCGPMRTTCLNGERYFMLFVDDFTRMTWLFLLKKKSETFSCFQVFKELTENEIDMKISPYPI
jgi:hypothetical protein